MSPDQFFGNLTPITPSMPLSKSDKKSETKFSGLLPVSK
jgi:hypothetical protein